MPHDLWFLTSCDGSARSAGAPFLICSKKFCSANVSWPSEQSDISRVDDDELDNQGMDLTTCGTWIGRCLAMGAMCLAALPGAKAQDRLRTYVNPIDLP